MTTWFIVMLVVFGAFKIIVSSLLTLLLNPLLASTKHIRNWKKRMRLLQSMEIT